MHISDRSLLRHYLNQGDNSSLEQLLQRHEAALLRLANSLLMDYAAAQDVVQESFLKLLEAAKKILAQPGSAEGCLLGWLITVTRHRCLDRLRRRRLLHLDEQRDTKGPVVQPPEQAYEQDESDAILWQLVGELPDLERAAVILRYRDSCSYQEIAQHLDKSVNHIGVLLHQAIGRLRNAPQLRQEVQL